MIELLTAYLGTVAFAGFAFGVVATQRFPTRQQFISMLVVCCVPVVNVAVGGFALVMAGNASKLDWEAA